MRGKLLGMAAIAAGAIAILTLVNPALSDTRDFGPVPEEAFVVGTEINADLVPDFVEYAGHSDGVIGYVAKGDIMWVDGEEPPEGPIPVVDRELNVIGHDVPGRGFVPLGADPADIAPVTSTTILYD